MITLQQKKVKHLSEFNDFILEEHKLGNKVIPVTIIENYNRVLFLTIYYIHKLIK